MNNPEPTGYLRVRVTSGGAAYPVEGAIVMISDGEAPGGIIYSLRTDESGLTDNVPLPAKDASLSVTPGNENPFMLYRVEVMKDGYMRSIVNEVEVFEGVGATLPVNLVPLGVGEPPYGIGESGL